jgi:succinate-acetate transporter protein
MDTPTPAQPLPLADPTAMGLIGLAVGCAALLPIALGLTLTPEALKTAAVFCLLFGGGCQLFAGLGGFVNRNLFGATLFTAFAFNWGVNAWMLWSVAGGTIPDPTVLLAVDLCFLLIFLVMTWGFGYFSGLLFAFLADIDLMYVLKIIAGLTGTHALALPIAGCTLALALLALWIAFALLINPVVGRRVFPFPGPLFKAGPRS